MELKEIEKKVLDMVIDGQTNISIGEEIGYSEKTVCRIIKRIYKVFGVAKRIELVREVLKQKAA